jgi:hypothetical protein
MEIACLPADNTGNKLWLKDFRQIEGRFYIKYKSTYNTMPFREVEIFNVDGGANFVITGDDGTILYRFPCQFIVK